MTQERKNELYEQMMAWICEHNTDEELFHLLHDEFGMTKEELHDYSIESLYEFFNADGQLSKAPCGVDSGIEDHHETARMELSDFISEVSGMVKSEDKSAVLDWASLAAFLANAEFSGTTLETELHKLYLPLCYVRNNFSDYILQESLAMDALGSEVIYGAMLFAAGYSELDVHELSDEGVLMKGYIPLSKDEKGSLSVVSLSDNEDILFVAQNEEADHIRKCIRKAAGLAEKDGVSIQTVLRDTAPAWLRLTVVTDPTLMDAIKISCTASTAISDITVYDQVNNTVTQYSTQGLTTEQRNAIFCCSEAPEMIQQM